MIPKAITAYFGKRSWKIAPYQKKAWEAYSRGESGLIHSPTGTGKSLAAWFGPVAEYLNKGSRESKSPEEGKILWITPLRALAVDTAQSLEMSVREIGLDWEVGLRTGDTPSNIKAKQKKKLPRCLVTTPESLSLALSYETFQRHFRAVDCVVVDEWHELISTKRGVQLELCVARLRKINTRLRTWGLSATLGDPNIALKCLMGSANAGRLILGPPSKVYEIHSILPDRIERFPWSGHIGLTLLPKVIKRINKANTSLVFTNTRAQAEIWYEKLIQSKPDWRNNIALHHSSIAKSERKSVENGLKNGRLRCVVCTSSLDLGVDFQPVDQVLQVGSPKGISRLLQRAGRSGHAPGRTSSIFCVPTNALELAEIAAARIAQLQGKLESRIPIQGALDVLAQHCVTLSLAEGLNPDSLLQEVKSSFAFKDISTSQWEWLLGFISNGGSALQSYPDYRRVEQSNSLLRCTSKKIAQRHRMSIGTIGSDNVMQIRWLRGGYIGSIEESFVAKLKRGDAFLFGGKLLELKQTRDMTAYVSLSKRKKRIVPRWQGGRIPLSTQLAETLQSLLAVADHSPASPEMEILAPLLELQNNWSRLPDAKGLLVEQTSTREGFHLYFFPFAGRFAHEGIGNLVALRLSRVFEATLHITANDYGFELYSRIPVDISETRIRKLLSSINWQQDLLEGINEAELSKRQFRDIAQIAGLVFPGYPGRGKSARQIQASSELIFEVLRKYDPLNELLNQSLLEVLDQRIDKRRIDNTLKKIQKGSISLVETPKLTPLAFPLWAERIRTQTISSETWEKRVRMMAENLNKAVFLRQHANQ